MPRKKEQLTGTTIRQKLKSGRRSYKCGLCGKIFPTPYELNYHVSFHTNEKLFPCPQCDKSFRTKYHLNVHVNAVHAIEKTFLCTFPNCSKKFTTVEYLKRHIDRLHNPNWVQNTLVPCPICSKEIRKCNIYNHLRSHTAKREEKIHKCDICSKMFRRQRTLKRHQNIHLPESEKPVFPCTLCDYKSKSADNLKVHMKLKHAEDPLKYICTCTFCNKQLRPQNMAAHLRSHIGEKPFICHLCDADFTKKILLKKHQEEAHLGERNYKCSHCSATFAYEYKLKRHIKDCKQTHICPICIQTFKSRNNLTYHIKKVHTREKAYKCDLCKKSFIENNQLKAHLVTHTKTRNFVCTVWVKRFLGEVPYIHICFYI